MDKNNVTFERSSKLLVGSLGLVLAGLALTASTRKNSNSLSNASGLGLAMKAFGISMLISCGSLGVGVSMLAKYLQVNSFKEFGAFMTDYLKGVTPSSEAEAEAAFMKRLQPNSNNN